MAEEKEKGSNPILGVSVTIKGDEIKQGADLFVKEIDRMEKATDNATVAMRKSFSALNIQLVKVNEQLKLAEMRLRNMAGMLQQQSQQINTAEYTALQNQVEQLTKEKQMLEQQIRSGGGASASGSIVKATKDQVAQAKQELKTLQSEYNKLNKEYEASLDKISNLKAKASGAPDTTKQHEYERQLAKEEKNLESIADRINDLKPELESAKRGYEELSKTMGTQGKHADSLRTKLRKLKEEMAELDKASPEYQEKAAQARDYQQQLIKINDETGKQSSLLTRLMGGTRNYQQMLSMLPPTMRMAVTEMNQFLKVGMKFIATPLGAIVTALALAFKGLQSWMTNTTDGQVVLARVTGYAQGVFNKLTQSVYSFIRSLRDIDDTVEDIENSANTKEESKRKEDKRSYREISAESNRIKKSRDELRQLIAYAEAYFDSWTPADERNPNADGSAKFLTTVEEKTDLLNYYKDKLKGFQDTLSENDRALSNKLHIGWIYDMIEGTKRLGAEVQKAATDFADYKERMLELERAGKAWVVTEATINQKIAEQQAILSSATSTTGTKIGATSTMGKLTDQLNAHAVEMARERYENASLGKIIDVAKLEALSIVDGKKSNEKVWADFEKEYGFTQSQVEEIVNAYAELTNAQSKQATDQTNTAQQIQQLHTQMLNEEREYAENLLAIRRDFARKEQDINTQSEEIALQALADSVEKRMAVRKLEHEKQLEQIERARQDAIEQAKAAARTEFGQEKSLTGRAVNSLIYADTLTSEQENSLNSVEKQIRERYKQRVAQADDEANVNKKSANLQYNEVNDLLSQYQDYTAKKLALDIQYGEDRERIMRAIAAQEAIINDGASTIQEKDNAQTLLAQLQGLSNERQRQYKQEQAEITMNSQMEQLKRNPAYLLAMQNVQKVSTNALQTLLGQLREPESEVAKMDPEKAQTIANLMESINNELLNRNPFEAMQENLNKILSLNAQRDKLTKLAKEYESSGGGVLNGEIVELSDILAQLDDVETQLVGTHQNYQMALEKSTQQLQGIFSQLGALGSSISGKFGNALNGLASIGSSMLSARQNYSFQSMQKNNMLKDGAQNANWSNMNSAGKASTVLAAAQAAYDSSMLVASIFPKKGSQKEYEKYAKRQAEMNNLTQSVLSYQLAVLKAANAEEHWFGNDALQGLRDSWEVASQAKDQYFAKLKEQQERYHNKDKDDNWSGVVASSIAGAIGGAFTGAALTAETGPGAILGAAIGAAVGTAAGIATNNLVTNYGSQQTSAQNNLRIETRKRKKSFLGIGGHDQETADLRTWARQQYGADLFDTDGWIDVDLATQILENYGEKLQGQTKETIEQLIELRKQYDEYQEALKDYVKSLYEPLVDNAVDAIWQWFDTGRDALSAFKEEAAGTFRSIVSDMIRTIVLSKVFDNFEDNIKDLYEKYSQGALDERSLIQKVTAETDAVFQRFEASAPAIEGMLTSIDEVLKSKGIDISASGTQSTATRGAFSGMAQDVGEEMNGRLTVIQIQGETIIGQLAAMVVNQSTLLANSATALGYITEIRDIQLNSLDYLRKIQLSTNELYQINERLAQIEQNTKSL